MKRTNCIYLHRCNAKVAQLVELQPSKLVVASSSLVFRSIKPQTKVWGFLFKEANLVFTKIWINPDSFLHLHHSNAKVAQLVELQPSKLVVASSSLVFRSKNLKRKFGVFYI